MYRNWMLIVFMLLIVACNGTKSETATQPTAEPAKPAVQADIIQDAPEQIVTQGKEAAQQLMRALKDELVQAIQDGGVVHAVTFCSEQALQLTAEVEADLGENVDLKRVSEQFRNPANKPDKLEETALEWLKKQTEGGTTPDYFVQQITENNTNRYRYYQPIRIDTPCLACHGPADQMKPELKTLLKERYPNDHATGYKKGDLRGAIRVEILPVDGDNLESDI